MKAGELRPTQQPVEDMSHLMEKSHDIRVSHQRWLVPSWLGQVRNHCGEWEAPFPRGKIVPTDEGPYSRVGVF